MRATQLIDTLQQLVAAHGDLTCAVEDAEFRGEYWPIRTATTAIVTMVDWPPNAHAPVFRFVYGE